MRDSFRLAGAIVQPGSRDPQLPLDASEYSRRKRRVLFQIGLAALAALLCTGYVYNRSLDPIRAEDSFDAGRRQVVNTRYQQALMSLDRAIQLRTGFAEAILLRASVQSALNKPELAIPDLNEAIRLRPNDPEPYLHRAGVHLILQQFREAIVDCERAIALDSALDRGYNLRGIALRELGQRQQSLDDLNRAVALRPDMDNLYQRASAYQELGQHASAITDFSRVIHFSPTNSQVYFARAKSYRELGDGPAADRDHRMGRMIDSH
ncbi:MAG: tetratricopeptide repeat protein [Gemmatimonadales bacterium]